MKSAIRLFLNTASALIMTCAVPSVAFAQIDVPPISQVGQPAPVTQMIIKLRGDDGTVPARAAASASRLSIAAGVKLVPFRPMSGATQVFSLPTSMPYSEVEKIAKKLMKLPNVIFAQPDSIVQLHQWPSDPLFDQTASPPGQFGLYAPPSAPATQPRSAAGSNMGEAWDITTGYAGRAIVAVIDTGILQHSDLAGRILPGYDMVTDPTNRDGNGRDSDASDPGDWGWRMVYVNGVLTNTYFDSSWHGTRVAGIIGAVANNGIGIAGVNWNARIVPVRAISEKGGLQSDVIDAMRWTAGLAVPGAPLNPKINKARVVNMSLGDGTFSCPTAFQLAVNDLTAANVSVVASSGNDNIHGVVSSPAICSGVISVTSIGHFGHRASYANVNSKVAIAAAGGEINSSIPKLVVSTGDSGLTTPNNSNTYQSGQGTSFSAPLVTGVVSLMRTAVCRPLKPGAMTMMPADIIQILKLSARPFASTSTCANGAQFPPGNCGAGILDAAAAIKMATAKFGSCSTNLVQEALPKPAPSN